ncbi:lipopolysaccharide biosynthesis protein [Catenovulum sp. SM1970]|uniref:lipopolysaccharide biosynthesis protein n=1 Tax=Marinifaba aquimaris TaxID=2741323 RepID=UPI001572623E|nr:lipopolysaccharide biosynthesis protein [Marinifaba aquimaris]NTS76174.1 lipopolysaccharide biosynthesis protein [Marinifaba aquimaris]
MRQLLKLPKLSVQNPLVATAMYAISIVFMKGLSLIMLPFLTHNLSQAEYGQLELLASLAAIASVIAGLGLAEALFRFAGMADDAEQAQNHFARLLNLAIWVAVSVTLISQISLGSLAIWLPETLAILDIRIVMLTIAFEAMIALPLGWLRMQNRVIAFCLIVCSRALIQISLTYALVSQGSGVTGILLAGLVSAGLSTICLLYCVKGDFNFSFNNQANKYLKYSVPMMLSGIIAFCILGADKWVLAQYASLEQVAIVAVAAKLALATVILLQPFSMWWSPRRFTTLKQEGEQRLTYFTQLGLILAVTVGIGLCFISPLLIDLLVPESYHSAIYIAPILILAMVLKEAVELINIGCLVGKTSKCQVVINAIAALITLALLFILIPKMQSTGLAYALLLGQAARLLMFFVASQHYLPLSYSLIRLIFLTSIGFTISFTLPLNLSAWHAACFAPVIGITFFALAYLCLFPKKANGLKGIIHAWH